LSCNFGLFIAEKYSHSHDLGLTGSAYVRRCELLLFTYQIGLEFAGNLAPRI
jgi:hypothetical protein